jgi:hypothetical protein
MLSQIVYGYVGAQWVYYEDDYINNLLMSQPYGMAAEG